MPRIVLDLEDGDWAVTYSAPDKIVLTRVSREAKLGDLADDIRVSPRLATMNAGHSVVSDRTDSDSRKQELAVPDRGKRLTDEEKERILTLFHTERVRNKSEIARRLGTTPQTVLKVIREAKKAQQDGTRTSDK